MWHISLPAEHPLLQHPLFDELDLGAAKGSHGCTFEASSISLRISNQPLAKKFCWKYIPGSRLPGEPEFLGCRNCFQHLPEPRYLSLLDCTVQIVQRRLTANASGNKVGIVSEACAADSKNLNVWAAESAIGMGDVAQLSQGELGQGSKAQESSLYNLHLEGS